MKQSGHGKVTSIRTTLGIFMMVCMLFAGIGLAQIAAAEEPGAATAEETKPSYPAGLDDLSIDLEELQLRLIPLTTEQLGPLAAEWQEHARAATQAAVDKSVAIRSAEEAEAEKLREERLALLEERRSIFDKFSAVIFSFETKGGDTAQVEALRAYLSAITMEERSSATAEEFTDSVLNWLVSPEGGLQVGFRIAVVVGSLFALLIIARIVRGWARRLFARITTLSKLLQGFLVMVVYWLTIAFGLMIVLAALGVNITPLFALVGGASFIIAFAMQETLSNLAAGLMIMINRPFDEGDFVQVAGLGGSVKHVSIVSTTIATPDNQVIVIPNSKVWGDVITNVTASDTRRVDLVFGIGYSDSIEQAQRVLEEVVAQHPLILKEPAPVIRVSELADSSVNFIVRPWTKTSDYWSVYWDLQRAVKEAFDANDISIPFPQTDMHLHVIEKGKDAGPAVLKTQAGGDTAHHRDTGSYARDDNGKDEHSGDENERD